MPLLQTACVFDLLLDALVRREFRVGFRVRFPYLDEQEVHDVCIVPGQLVHQRKIRLAGRSDNRAELN